MVMVMQNLIFPTETSLRDRWLMFYRGSRGVLADNEGQGSLCIDKFEHIDFSTYFNSVSINKWKQYTNIGKVRLCLEAQGVFDLTLLSYSMKNNVPVCNVFERFSVNNEEPTKLAFEFPQNDEEMLAFSLSSYSEVKIFGGYYEGEFPDAGIRGIELALVTTTCWKETYIIDNIEKLKTDILDNGLADIGNHVRVHIVDNGRTLKRKDFPIDGRIYLHSNKNTGGSGGFARGMLEAKKQTPSATHVLLMDDDVMLLPESVYRTYVLLKVLRTEYHGSFISGAMLMLEEMNVQYEDIGSVDRTGNFTPLKPNFNQECLVENLLNERIHYGNRKDVYQAWWYCCIPMPVIKKHGLPLPLFIRGDDCEYGLRCKADILSMNGICIWHAGFYGKYSASMAIYQPIRNLLIAQATTGVLEKVDLIARIKKNYRDNMLKFDYDAAELALRAFEDFMKGPGFIKVDRGEQIMKENAKFNAKMLPLETFSYLDIDLYQNPYEDCRRGFFMKWLYRITYNGHRFIPQFLLNKEIVVIPFDFGYTPGKMAMKKNHLCVNPIAQTGCIKEIDRERFKELQNRYYKDMCYYKKNHKKIKRSYAKKREYLTSDKFWMDYLGL